jgi:hypothetical protein
MVDISQFCRVWLFSFNHACQGFKLVVCSTPKNEQPCLRAQKYQ